MVQWDPAMIHLTPLGGVMSLCEDQLQVEGGLYAVQFNLDSSARLKAWIHRVIHNLATISSIPCSLTHARRATHLNLFRPYSDLNKVADSTAVRSIKM